MTHPLQGLWYFRWNEASLFWTGMAVVCCYGLPGCRLCHCRLICALCCWWFEKITITANGDDRNCWLVLYQSDSRDWLAVVWVYLSAILLDFSARATRLLLSSWIETRKVSVKSRITLNWISLRSPNIAEISNHATFVCPSPSSFIMFRWMEARLQDFWSYCKSSWK